MFAPRLRASLDGVSTPLDPRINAVRGDLADVALAGILFAPHYAAPVAMACTRAFAPMLTGPAGEQQSELLAGEHFMMLDQAGGWAWGYSAHDHYVGYVAADALAHAAGLPPEPEPGDPVAIARSFLGMGYLWGGRGGAGIDCSGLIQRALAGIGVAAPRDSDLQSVALGQPLADGTPLHSGDLIFFEGHVGMMADATNLIHATRHHGKTVEEPLATVAARTAITQRRRIAA